MPLTSTTKKIWQPDSILHTAADQSVVVIDIPRSIEEAQVLPGQATHRRVLSSQPSSEPWKLPEPKSPQARDSGPVISLAAAIAELMTLETVSTGLKSAKASHHGPWCLPRKHTEEQEGNPEQEDARKQRNDTHGSGGKTSKAYASIMTRSAANSLPPHFPPRSQYVSGTIEESRTELIQRAPVFDLIVLDPPWPSRSVRRKRAGNSYGIVNNIPEARDLLSGIPIAAKLSPNGLVAVWITNKAAIHDLLMAPEHGIFAQWGLEPVGEWIWLKITSAGDPIFDIQSKWRKPWERLLLARPKQRSYTSGVDDHNTRINIPRRIPTKVILAVPDLHSRKPNLRGVLQAYMPSEYETLEVFARNLTAGWWSWGKEVLLFQGREHWVEMDEEGDIQPGSHTFIEK